MKPWITILAILAAATVGAWLATRPTEHQRRFHEIQTGMTIDEVDEILGKSDYTICGINLGKNVRTFTDGIWKIDIEVTLGLESRVVTKRMTARLAFL